jgi:hypothetical protein
MGSVVGRLHDPCFLKSDAFIPLGWIGANPASTVFYPRLSAFIVAKNSQFLHPLHPLHPCKKPSDSLAACLGVA